MAPSYSSYRFVSSVAIWLRSTRSHVERTLGWMAEWSEASVKPVTQCKTQIFAHTHSMILILIWYSFSQYDTHSHSMILILIVWYSYSYDTHSHSMILILIWYSFSLYAYTIDCSYHSRQVSPHPRSQRHIIWALQRFVDALQYQVSRSRHMQQLPRSSYSSFTWYLLDISSCLCIKFQPDVPEVNLKWNFGLKIAFLK